jgi:hypothetical protein
MMAPAPWHWFAYQAACPYCEQVLDIRIPLYGDHVEPGWVTVCLDCGEVGTFERKGSDTSLGLRKATNEELFAAMEIPGLRLLREEALARKEASHGANNQTHRPGAAT